MPEQRWCCGCQQDLPIEVFTVPSGVADHCRSCRAEHVRRWRELNPEYVAAYNAERRLAYREKHPLKARPCVVCGRPFAKRPDAVVCGEECRRQRKLEQRRELHRQAAAA